MEKRRLSINLIANIIQFGASLIISFFFTPYIVSSVGAEAYSFYSLAGTFISYFTLVASAVNSMASRFITIEWHKGNKEKVNEYFSTVFYANVGISVLLSLLVVLFVLFMENMINIPNGLVTNVKWLFALVLGAGVLSTLFSVYNSATFCANRLDLKSAVLILNSILRVIILTVLFVGISPNILFLGVSNLVCTLIEAGTNILFTKKLMIGVRIKPQLFRWKHIGALVGAGIWNAINQLNTIILNGLDVLMANLFITVYLSGVLGIAKTIPTQLFSLVSMLGGVFLPQITIAYANNNRNDLKKQFENSFNIMGFGASIALAGFFVFGQSFYRLWMPDGEPGLLFILSSLSMTSLISTASTQTIGNVALLTNKLRLPVLITTARSLLGLGIVYLFIRFTPFGIYAIAGVQSILGLIYDLVFTVPYAAHCIQYQKRFFYYHKVKMILSTIALMLVFYVISIVIVPTSWGSLLLSAGVSAAVGCLFNLGVYLNREQRKSALGKVKKIIVRNNGRS